MNTTNFINEVMLSTNLSRKFVCYTISMMRPTSIEDLRHTLDTAEQYASLGHQSMRAIIQQVYGDPDYMGHPSKNWHRKMSLSF